MNELERTLIGDSAAAPPDHIIDSVDAQLASRSVAGAPHTIYQELWHMAFWQSLTLSWIHGDEVPYPEHASDGFPGDIDIQSETWDQLRDRFLKDIQTAAVISQNEARLQQPIRCPSRSGLPTRIMAVREQLESLAAHNAYHLGRIVLLRQLLGSWPPPSGGDSW